MERILVKIAVNEDSISVKTVSRTYCSSQRFIILHKVLKNLKVQKSVIISDIYSFANLYLKQEPTGKYIIKIDFTWLKDCGENKLAGRQQRIVLAYEELLNKIEASLKCGKTDFSMLSRSEQGKPSIEFYSIENLKAVVQNKNIRRKLGKFFDCHFQWQDTKSIQIFDADIPYSFFFTEHVEEGVNRQGISGGIILHKNYMRKAYYEIHT